MKYEIKIKKIRALTKKGKKDAKSNSNFVYFHLIKAFLLSSV